MKSDVEETKFSNIYEIFHYIFTTGLPVFQISPWEIPCIGLHWSTSSFPCGTTPYRPTETCSVVRQYQWESWQVYRREYRHWKISWNSSEAGIWLCEYTAAHAHNLDNESVWLRLTSSVLQIRRGKRDNLGILFHITPLKCMLWHLIRTVSERQF